MPMTGVAVVVPDWPSDPALLARNHRIMDFWRRGVPAQAIAADFQRAGFKVSASLVAVVAHQARKAGDPRAVRRRVRERRGNPTADWPLHVGPV